jgi:hypothetical protein
MLDVVDAAFRIEAPAGLMKQHWVATQGRHDLVHLLGWVCLLQHLSELFDGSLARLSAVRHRNLQILDHFQVYGRQRRLVNRANVRHLGRPRHSLGVPTTNASRLLFRSLAPITPCAETNFHRFTRLWDSALALVSILVLC